MDESPLVLPPSEKRDRDLNFANFDSFTRKQSRQSPHPCTSDPMNVRERVLRGYKMIIKQGTKRMTLLRFLLSKMLYGEEGISIEEYLCIFHLYYDLVEITESHFVEKNSSNLDKVGILLSKLSDNRIFPLNLNEMSRIQMETLLERFLPTRREFYGLVGQREIGKSFKLILNDTLVPRKLPPKAYIGVGYKDKGTRRDVSVNGCQGWQEIGSHLANREREAEELDSSTFISQKD